MAYIKRTGIAGFDTTENKPDRSDMNALYAWLTAHSKSYSLSGHWTPDAALRFARKRGLVGPVTITHRVSDTSGMGRGGLDAEWQADDADVIQPVTVTADADRAEAEADVEAVWGTR